MQITRGDLLKLDSKCLNNLKLILKWGCDGSAGQQYKHVFNDENSSDAAVFFTSTVPLQLSAVNETKEEIVVWKNPRPSSSRFCRPIRLQFFKESADSTREELEYMEKQINSLVTFNSVIDSKNVEIKYELVFTMIDGKVKML